jgi:hypothetical protein
LYITVLSVIMLLRHIPLGLLQRDQNISSR